MPAEWYKLLDASANKEDAKVTLPDGSVSIEVLVRGTIAPGTKLLQMSTVGTSGRYQAAVEINGQMTEGYIESISASAGAHREWIFHLMTDNT